jgi:hypothetical protein
MEEIMDVHSFTRGLKTLRKCMEQAQGRVLNSINLPRRPDRDELREKLTDAAVAQWKMERIQSYAENDFILYATKPVAL